MSRSTTWCQNWNTEHRENEKISRLTDQLKKQKQKKNHKDTQWKKGNDMEIVLGCVLKHKWPIRRMWKYYITKLNGSHRQTNLPHWPFINFKQIVVGGVEYKTVIVNVVGSDVKCKSILGVVDVRNCNCFSAKWIKKCIKIGIITKES